MTTAWYYLAVVAVVFLANLIPAFAPPTWVILVLFKLNWRLNPVALVPDQATTEVQRPLLAGIAALSRVVVSRSTG
jgi:hypothetical protein